MDPLTAALELAKTIAEIVKLTIESQPPDVRAEIWRLYLEDMKAWRAFWQQLLPTPPKT